MKKFLAFALLVSVLLSAAVGFAACNDKPSDTALPMLYASGEDIVDAEGNTVVLRGTNFGGWLVQEDWMCPTDQTDTLSTLMTLYSRFGILPPLGGGGAAPPGRVHPARRSLQTAGLRP